MDKSLAQQMFNAFFEQGRLEEEICDKVLEILGYDPNDTDKWPFDDMGWDWYDESIELHGADPGLEINGDQFTEIAKLGFGRVFVNHTDNMETHYPSGWRVKTSNPARCRADKRPYGGRETKRLARIGWDTLIYPGNDPTR